MTQSIVEIMGRAAWQREKDRMDALVNAADAHVGSKVHAHMIGPYEDRNLLYEDMMQAALTALREAGLVVVPREPTPRMVFAGESALWQWHQTRANGAVHGPDYTEEKVAYRAMITAAETGR